LTAPLLDDLLARLTLRQKVAQLTSVWVQIGAGGEVAPYQGNFAAGSEGPPVAEQLAHGIGQLTRPFGSAPVTPRDGITALDELQRQLVEDTAAGIPAIVHEECLTGFMAHGATTFPAPLGYASTFDPDLIREVGRTIGAQMRSVGVHQGLAPVMDVVRDPRWGRVEETFGEDPFLCGVIGSAYVRGIEDAGAVATLKHFAGYSSSEGGRNLAPAHLGPRELADVFLVPFEMAVREGGARAVMNAYQDIDGEPAAASHHLLTEVLRDEWGFDGIVVADYFSISFLHSLHGLSDGPATSAALALRAGLDVELPNPDCYTDALLDAVERGLVDEADVDRSLRRVLQLKRDLGLLDEGGATMSAVGAADVDLDPPDARALARRVAERSLVLLKNDGGLLPLDARAIGSVALIGPNADSSHAVLGNYTFHNHVAVHFDDAPDGVHVVTIAEGVRDLLGDDRVTVTRGCEVLGEERTGFVDAAAAANAADVAVVVIGDQAGHFGAGTSGEGTDTDDLSLPGVQAELVAAVASTGTPTVVVLVSGRPYAIAGVLDDAAAVVEAWFPGEEAGHAVADVLFGLVNPSGKTPLSFGRGAGQQPFTYHHKPLGRRGYARSSTRPVVPFGHGLSYTTFAYDDLAVEPDSIASDGTVTITCTVRNAGAVAGDEVVQLYLNDPVATITRPVQELKGFARVALEPGETKRVRFEVPADLVSFTGVDLRRRVEPGTIRVEVGASSADIRLRGAFEIEGEVRIVGPGRALRPAVAVEPV
jgi:beta-glucosidase